MKTLKESCEALLDGFKKGEGNDAAFTKAYSESLPFIQLIYLEESAQFEAASEAVKEFKKSVPSVESRLQLETVFSKILKGLFFANPIEIRA
jgi:hypothetical protein